MRTLKQKIEDDLNIYGRLAAPHLNTALWQLARKKKTLKVETDKGPHFYFYFV
jgi:hypothetical protein